MQNCITKSSSKNYIVNDLIKFSAALNWWTFGWNRKHFEKNDFNFAKKKTKINNVLPAYMYKCTLMCIEVSYYYYYSVNSFSRSKNLMYTTLQTFWKRITTESHELSLECCWKETLQLKMAVSELNNSKILAQKIVKPNTNYQTTMLWKYWNGLITKMSFIILQNLIFENCLKF